MAAMVSSVMVAMQLTLSPTLICSNKEICLGAKSFLKLDLQDQILFYSSSFMVLFSSSSSKILYYRLKINWSLLLRLIEGLTNDYVFWSKWLSLRKAADASLKLFEFR